MSTKPIHVFSEIGKLKKVMLHRPGKELENLMPDYLERLLFDDIPFLEDAQKEHDNFAQALRNEGALRTIWNWLKKRWPVSKKRNFQKFRKLIKA